MKENVNINISKAIEKIAGNVPDSIFKKLMNDYEAEQVKLADEITEIEKKLEIAASDESDVAKWITLIKRFIQSDELDTAERNGIEKHGYSREVQTQKNQKAYDELLPHVHTIVSLLYRLFQCAMQT